jgi:hypothetical protein
MFKKISLTAAAAVSALVALPAAAEARPRYDDGYNNSYYSQSYRGDRYYSGDRQYRGNRQYRGDSYGRGYDNRYYGRSSRYYGSNRRCRDNGTTGTILGAIAGGLLGKEIADGGRYRRGDGTAGAIIGAGVGALAGRAIDRKC